MTPNTDRFLTRIFDKEQKEMWYAGSQYGQITNEGFYGLSGHVFIPFGDRFIPMQCYGFKEDNRPDGNLIYEFDFIKTHAIGLYLLINLKDGCWIGKSLDGRYSVDLDSLKNRFSVKGNKFEQPELLEAKA